MIATKKATQKNLLISSLMVGLLATLAGCDKKPADVPAASDAAVSSAAVEASVAAPVVAACDGTAPAGELTPVRIEAANTTRTEHGLFEGPVWING